MIQTVKVILFSLALLLVLIAGLREVSRSDYAQAVFYGLLAAVAVAAILGTI